MVLRNSTINTCCSETTRYHTNSDQPAPCPLRLTGVPATTIGIMMPTRTNIRRSGATRCFHNKNNYDTNQRLVVTNNCNIYNNQSTIEPNEQMHELITSQSEKLRSHNNGNRIRSLVSQHRARNVIVDLNKRTNVFRHIYGFEFNALAGFAIVVLIIMLTGKSIEGLLSDTQLNHTATLCPLVRDCHCKWSNGKQGASCERRNLKTIPMLLPNTTLVLDMSENNLVHLPQHIFRERRLTNLQKLYLTECQLSYIADEAFAHLTNLVELDLSHNYLQQVPSKSLEPLQHSLRKLFLSHNMIHMIDSSAFVQLTSLTNLDLSNNQLSQMKPNAFQGLGELRDLKLSENRLSQISLNVVSDFREFLILDLYGNPWHCDCELRQTIDWMSRHHVQQSISPTCATPLRHKDIRWQSVKPDEFLCPPVIVNKQNELIVGAGSNVTLACVARGSPPFTFVWFQDEKNLTGRNTNNASDPPPSTKLLEEKRYEIAEELGTPNVTTSILYLMNLRLTDTSLFLCWVENAAGYALGNFSLIVNDSPPAHIGSGGASTVSSTLDDLSNSFMRFMRLDSGDTSTTQIAIVALGFILLLVAPIICLITFKQVLVARRRPAKSSSPSEFKSPPQQHANGKLSSSNKFAKPGDSSTNKLANSNSAHMFASSDEDDDATEDDDENQSSSIASSSIATGSSSTSCRKSSGNHHKVMAVNDLDGFIEHMRSGIINMDYHTMSPVDQFNNVSKHPQQQQQQQQNFQPLAHLNHFPTSSNASSQPLFYNNGHGNGSNSMATTLSDLSPSSGSASTSFANNPNCNLIAAANNIPLQQQQYLAAANMAETLPSSGTMRRHLVAQPMTNCDPQVQQQNQRLMMDVAGHHHQQQQALPTSVSGYSDSFSEEQLINAARHQMPPQYDHHHHHHHQQQQQHHLAGFDQQLYNQMQHQQHLNTSRPNSMIGQSYQQQQQQHPASSQQQQRYNPMQQQDASGFQIL